MSLPGKYKWRVYQGDDTSFTLTYKEGASGAEVGKTLTGATLLGEIKTEPGAASATATLTVTADADQTANPGKMTVSLPAAQAALLTEPIYHFDVQVTWADTLIQTVLAGPVIVSAEVSVQA